MSSAPVPHRANAPFLIAGYKRWETQKRLAVFYLVSQCISGFSGALGYGLSLIPKNGVLKTWRWIFLVSCTLAIKHCYSSLRRKLN